MAKVYISKYFLSFVFCSPNVCKNQPLNLEDNLRKVFEQKKIPFDLKFLFGLLLFGSVNKHQVNRKQFEKLYQSHRL